MAEQWHRSQWGIQLRLYLSEQIVPPGEQMPLPGMPQDKITGRWRMFPWLAEVLSSSDGELRAGRDYMARIAGVHPTTVSKWCSRWVTAGWLVRQVRGHKGVVSVYRLTIPEWAVQGGAGATHTFAKGGVAPASGWRNSATPEEEKKGARSAHPTAGRRGQTTTCPAVSVGECRRGRTCGVHGSEFQQQQEADGGAA